MKNTTPAIKTHENLKRACPLMATIQFESMDTRFKVHALAHLIDFFTRNLVVWVKLGADLRFQSNGLRNVYSMYVANH